MLDKATIIKVSNRDNGSVGYRIPEMGIQRLFQRGEEKEVTMEELRKLSYLPGGQVLLNECLLVQDQEALRELNPNFEPEYFYTEKEIEELLLRGTQDQLLDCLDFAPEGVIELMKGLAVKLEINDLAKREAISEKTGLNISKAIEINRASKEEDAVPAETKQRRTAAPAATKIATPVAPVRRTTPTASATKSTSSIADAKFSVKNK